MCEKQGQKQFGFRTLFWCFLVLAHFLQPASAFWSTFGARARALPGRYIVLAGVDANADFVAPDELGGLGRGSPVLPGGQARRRPSPSVRARTGRHGVPLRPSLWSRFWNPNIGMRIKINTPNCRSTTHHMWHAVILVLQATKNKVLQACCMCTLIFPEGFGLVTEPAMPNPQELRVTPL